jgi:gliding motility-associated-like protein
MNNENSKLGQHFKETFSDFKAEPSPAVWENIAQHPSLSTAPIPKPSLFTPAKLIIAGAVITTVAVVSWLALTHEPLNSPAPGKNMPALSTPATSGSAADPAATPAEGQPGKETQAAMNTASSKPDHETRTSESALPSKMEKSAPAATLTNIPEPKSTAKIFNSIPVKPWDQTPKITAKQPAVNAEPLAEKASPASSPVAVCPDQMICKGESASLWASGGESYLWNTGETNATISVTPEITTVYSVTITDAVGELTTENVEVSVSICQDLYVPNAFTPDGDTYNDIFKAFGENIQKFNMMIFARNGQMVFETNDISQGWDGKVRGNTGEAGVYIYKITYTNAGGESRTKTGQVNLIR